jgi:Tol biopolymer transport system component
VVHHQLNRRQLYYGLRSIIFCSALLLASLPLTAAPVPLDAALDSLSALHEFHEVALAPDHSRVAWIETAPAKSDERPSSSIYLRDLREPSSPAKRIGDPAGRVQGLAWSQDGRLAFLSDAESHGQMQLYVVEKPGHGKARKIGDLEGYVSDPHWSPDGKSIAVARIEGITRVPGPTEATPPASGVIASKTLEQRLAIINVANGALRTISPADMYVYEFDWSPDSKNLVYLGAPGDGDNNW